MSALNRGAARLVLWPLLDSAHMDDSEIDGMLDELGRCVRPAPTQTIDRDALVRYCATHEPINVEGFADEILALLRPVGGVALTREEAALAAEALRAHAAVVELIKHPSADAMRALASQLEAVL